MFSRFRSKELWERVDWFSSFHSSEERHSLITFDDWLPFTLAILKVILWLGPIAYLDFLLWSYNEIVFYVFLALNAPVVMFYARFVDFLIKRYVVVVIEKT